MDSNPTVGVIGLGVMGGNMAENLLEAEYSVLVHDLDSARIEAMGQLGAASRDSPNEIATDSDIVITSLPDGQSVREVALGSEGLIQSDDDFVYVDMSTIGPTTIAEIAEKLESNGIQTISAPVSGGGPANDGRSGGEPAARHGNLTIMVGSNKPVPKRCLELFDVLGEKVVEMDSIEGGQVAKICNNMISAASMVSLCESLIFAEKAGVSKDKLIDIISAGTGRTWISENRAEELIGHHFDPGFKATYLYKDLGIYLSEAREYGVPIPQASIAHELFKSLDEKGHGTLDATAIILQMEDMAGLSN